MSPAWEKWDSRSRAFSCAVTQAGGNLLIAQLRQEANGKGKE
jgi:hypothetical protein